MAHTEAYYENLLTTIDAQITTIASNLTGRFTVGRVTYDGPSALKALQDFREKVIEWMTQKIPQENVETIAADFSRFGVDEATYVNEPNY